MAQLLCQHCHLNDRSNLLSRCCQQFLCFDCRDKFQKSNTCNCGKPTTKKWCQADPKLYQLLGEYYSGRPAECSRCDNTMNLKVRYCCECEVLMCEQCVQEVHAVGLYRGHAVHDRVQGRRVLEERRGNTGDVQTCPEHRLKKEYICQCTAQPICNMCLRAHKEACGKRYRLLSEYKSEYFASMLSKLELITEHKEQLKKNLVAYKDNFEKQKKLKEASETMLKETFANLEKLLEFKKVESMKSFQKYWEECQTAYERTLREVDVANKEYDDYARLVERMSDKMIGLEYLDKRIVRKTLQFESFQFKITNTQSVQKQILSLAASSKKWQPSSASPHPTTCCPTTNPLQPIESTTSTSHIRRSSSVFQNQTPHLLSQIHDDPLLPRPIKLLSSSTQIHYQFLHLPYQNESYEIEFGVGMKSKGQEVFKKVHANPNGKGIIKGLNPQTNYRVRMRVVNGSWGAISEVSTLPPQGFTTTNCSFAKGDNKGSIMFLKSGTLYANNGIEFGVHIWEIKIIVDKNSHAQSQTACISIGISNRQSKKALFIGTTLNYGYQRENFKMRVMVDCENNKMCITNEKQQEEFYQNLPEAPFYPTIINKGNSTVQVSVAFM